MNVASRQSLGRRVSKQHDLVEWIGISDRPKKRCLGLPQIHTIDFHAVYRYNAAYGRQRELGQGVFV
jgi:hypothetical protein